MKNHSIMKPKKEHSIKLNMVIIIVFSTQSIERGGWHKLPNTLFTVARVSNNTLVSHF